MGAAENTQKIEKTSSLRRRILLSVSTLILLSLLGSTISLYRVTEVNHLLNGINRVSVPLSRLFSQLQSDTEIFRREMERSLGAAHWKDPHWRPRQVPRWIQDVLEDEMARLSQLVANDSAWATAEEKQQWKSWAETMYRNLGELRLDSTRLHAALTQKDDSASMQLSSRWASNMEEWRRQIAWGAGEYDRSIRKTFSLAQARIVDLRTGLEVILGVVVALSLLMLWFGERALRPLAEVTHLVREIATRGLRKEDKGLLPDMPLSRNDEVSQRMAAVLLEREKMVETQKAQLREQNRLLRTMGKLNENVLHSIHSVLLVTDLNAQITQCNPVGVSWLQAGELEGQKDRAVVGSSLLSWARMKAFAKAGAPLWIQAAEQDEKSSGPAGLMKRIEPLELDNRVYGGQIMSLRDDLGMPHGAIVVFDDLTQELELQEKLHRAENLAAIGRMSAQVAHEVRNPLHSIGLEAEMAAEMAAKSGDIAVKQSLQSILASVDRLEKITENYLKLSRLSAGEKRVVDMGDVLETVLATYASGCEAQGIRVDWHREGLADLRVLGDPDLLEQALGNLLRNSMQALELFKSSGKPAPTWTPSIRLALGSAESGRVWLKVEDNGPGISPEILPKLFTPFVTTRSQGTGLGLSFVKKVFEDHGGRIEYRSAEGHGACFEIILPLAALNREMPMRPDQPDQPDQEVEYNANT